jgi:hypothetical protein
MRYASHMTLSKAVTADYFSEAEAAQALGITIVRLHYLLDHYVFNDGSRRPPNIEFTSIELILLSYWNKESRCSDRTRDNVIAIDDRKPGS